MKLWVFAQRIWLTAARALTDSRVSINCEENEKRKSIRRFGFGSTLGVETGRDRGEKYLKHKHMVQKSWITKFSKRHTDVHVNMTHISEPIRCVSFRVTDEAEMSRFWLSAHCYLICLLLSFAATTGTMRNLIFNDALDCSL